MYSKLPVPENEWSKENISYAMIYFPWIKGLIGVIIYGVFRTREWLIVCGSGISDVTFTILMDIVPMDELQRKYREMIGRICTELASGAEEVYRVICGIGIRIK